MAPEISIIVPAYNEEKHIVRCLDSILAQTFSDFEVLCIDDGSTDKTFDIITEYSKKDSRIVPLKNTGKGVSSARNFGIDNSKGKYIGFVDSDDFIQPQIYEFLHRAITENNCDMSCCNYIRTENFEIKAFDYNAVKCKDNDFYVYENEKSIIASSVCNKLVDKNLFYKKFKFENYKYGEDSLFCSNLWINTKNCFFVDLPLYCYYTNFSSVSYVDYSSRKWIDKINTDYLIYDNYLKNNNIFAATFFIGLNIIFLLSYRAEIEKTENYDSDIELINKIGKKYLNFYIKSDSFSVLKKIYVLTSYYCPLLYKLYRKIRSIF